jgi:peptidoglycan/xylan/chitin deacetylase (PgdA/CDA1 family)
MDDFRRQLDRLEEWGAVVLPLDEAVAQLQARTLPERAVVLTFDDGYASVVERAWPELLERGWPATLFVVSGYVGTRLRFPWDIDVDDETARLVTGRQLTEALGSGLDIGSHTVSHPWLPTTAPETRSWELLESRLSLQDLLGVPVRSLAYPTGGWNAAVRRATEEAGYTVGVTVDRGLNPPSQDTLALRRSFLPHDMDDVDLILEGAYTWLRPVDAVRRRKGPTR